MRKRMAALFSAILLLLAACSPASAGEQEDTKVTLTIMGKKTDMEKDYIQRIFQLYEQSGRCRLRIISMEDASYDAAIQEAFSSGEAPDILFQFNNSGLNMGHFNDPSIACEAYRKSTENLKSYMQRQWSFVGGIAGTFREMEI